MFNSNITKLDGCSGIILLEPSFFAASAPLTNTLVFLMSTLSILPECFLKDPDVITTLSPFLMFALLLLYFFLSFFADGKYEQLFEKTEDRYQFWKRTKNASLEWSTKWAYDKYKHYGDANGAVQG